MYSDTTSGDLTALTTDAKDTLVNAINEVDGKLLTDVPAGAVFTDTVYDVTAHSVAYKTYDTFTFNSGTASYEILDGSASITTEIVADSVKVYSNGLKLLTTTFSISYTTDTKNEIVFSAEPAGGSTIEIERIILS